jgi:hypothetical protein
VIIDRPKGIRNENGRPLVAPTNVFFAFVFKTARTAHPLLSFRCYTELLRGVASESRRFSAEKRRMMFALTDLLKLSTNLSAALHQTSIKQI